MGNKWNPGCCDCDDEDPCYCSATPLSVTLSGATGCLSVLNGTFGLSQINTCSWGFDSGYIDPDSPCVNGCLYPASTWYWLLSLNVNVSLAAGLGYYKIEAGTSWARYFFDGTTCSGPSTTPSTTLEYRRVDCTSGAGTYQAGAILDSNLGTNPTTCSIAF